MNAPPHRILMLAGDEPDLQSLRVGLAQLGHTICNSNAPTAALLNVQKFKPHAIVLDLKIGGDLLLQLWELGRFRETHLFFVLGESKPDRAHLSQARRFHYLPKKMPPAAAAIIIDELITAAPGAARLYSSRPAADAVHIWGAGR